MLSKAEQTEYLKKNLEDISSEINERMRYIKRLSTEYVQLAGKAWDEQYPDPDERADRSAFIGASLSLNYKHVDMLKERWHSLCNYFKETNRDAYEKWLCSSAGVAEEAEAEEESPAGTTAEDEEKERERMRRDAQIAKDNLRELLRSQGASDSANDGVVQPPYDEEPEQEDGGLTGFDYDWNDEDYPEDDDYDDEDDR